MPSSRSRFGSPTKESQDAGSPVQPGCAQVDWCRDASSRRSRLLALSSANGNATSLLSETIAAHGGGERWRTAPELIVEVGAGGLALTAKLQRSGLQTREARLSTDRQRIVFPTYPRPGYRGVFDQGTVRIESDAGEVVRERRDARAALRRPRRLLWWDDLDALYFGASSTWTYMAIPYVFETPGFEMKVGEPWRERGEVWRTLAVTFPEEIHTHSREQVFYVGEDGLIRRHDYTAEEFGGWARSAHYWYDQHDFGGLVMPRKRRVFLRRADNRARRHPVVVWIDVDGVVTRAATEE